MTFNSREILKLVGLVSYQTLVFIQKENDFRFCHRGTCVEEPSLGVIPSLFSTGGC